MSSYESRGYPKTRDSAFYDEPNPGWTLRDKDYFHRSHDDPQSTSLKRHKSREDRHYDSSYSDNRYPTSPYKGGSQRSSGGYYGPSEYDSRYPRDDYRNRSGGNGHEYGHKMLYYPSPNRNDRLRRSDKGERSPWNSYSERRSSKEQYYDYTRDQRDKRDRRDYPDDYGNRSFSRDRRSHSERGRKPLRSKDRENRSMEREYRGRDQSDGESSSRSRSSSVSQPSSPQRNDIVTTSTDRPKFLNEEEGSDFRRHSHHRFHRSRPRSRTPPDTPDRVSPLKLSDNKSHENHNFNNNAQDTTSRDFSAPSKDLQHGNNVDLRREISNSRHEYLRREYHNNDNRENTSENYNSGDTWRKSQGHFHRQSMSQTSTDSKQQDLRQTLTSSRGLQDPRRPQSPPLHKKSPVERQTSAPKSPTTHHSASSSPNRSSSLPSKTTSYLQNELNKSQPHAPPSHRSQSTQQQVPPTQRPIPVQSQLKPFRLTSSSPTPSPSPSLSIPVQQVQHPWFPPFPIQYHQYSRHIMGRPVQYQKMPNQTYLPQAMGPFSHHPQGCPPSQPSQQQTLLPQGQNQAPPQSSHPPVPSSLPTQTPRSVQPTVSLQPQTVVQQMSTEPLNSQSQPQTPSQGLPPSQGLSPSSQPPQTTITSESSIAEAKNKLILNLDQKDSEINQLEVELETVQKLKEHLLDPKTFPRRPPSPSPMARQCRPKADDQPPIFVRKLIQETQCLATASRDRLQYLNEGCMSINIYKEPSDFPFFHENALSFEQFKPILKKILVHRRQELRYKTESLQQEYEERYHRWREYTRNVSSTHRQLIAELQLIEQAENMNRRPRGRRGNTRKQPEVLEPKKDSNTRFLDSLADIPPLILDPHIRSLRFIDNNRHVPNCKSAYTLHRLENTWLPNEERTFVKLFHRYHKNFEQIASHLPYKSTKDCVKFYYVNKKRLDLRIQYDTKLSSPKEEPDIPSTTSVAWTRPGSRSSIRLSSKPTINYSEHNLEQKFSRSDLFSTSVRARKNLTSSQKSVLQENYKEVQQQDEVRTRKRAKTTKVESNLSSSLNESEITPRKKDTRLLLRLKTSGELPVRSKPKNKKSSRGKQIIEDVSSETVPIHTGIINLPEYDQFVYPYYVPILSPKNVRTEREDETLDPKECCPLVHEENNNFDVPDSNTTVTDDVLVPVYDNRTETPFENITPIVRDFLTEMEPVNNSEFHINSEIPVPFDYNNHVFEIKPTSNDEPNTEFEHTQNNTEINCSPKWKSEFPNGIVNTQINPEDTLDHSKEIINHDTPSQAINIPQELVDGENHLNSDPVMSPKEEQKEEQLVNNFTEPYFGNATTSSELQTMECKEEERSLTTNDTFTVQMITPTEEELPDDELSRHQQPFYNWNINGQEDVMEPTPRPDSPLSLKRRRLSEKELLLSEIPQKIQKTRLDSTPSSGCSPLYNMESPTSPPLPPVLSSVLLYSSSESRGAIHIRNLLNSDPNTNFDLLGNSFVTNNPTNSVVENTLERSVIFSQNNNDNNVNEDIGSSITHSDEHQLLRDTTTITNLQQQGMSSSPSEEAGTNVYNNQPT